MNIITNLQPSPFTLSKNSTKMKAIQSRKHPLNTNKVGTVIQLFLLFLVSFIKAEVYGVIKSCTEEKLNEKYPVMKSFLSEGDFGISQYKNIDVIYGKQYSKVTLTIRIGGRGGQVLDTIILSNFRSEEEIHRTLNDRGFKTHAPAFHEELVQEELEKMQNVMEEVLRNSFKKGSEEDVRNLIEEMNKVKDKKEEKFDPTTLSLEGIMDGL